MWVGFGELSICQKASKYLTEPYAQAPSGYASISMWEFGKDSGVGLDTQDDKIILTVVNIFFKT